MASSPGSERVSHVVRRLGIGARPETVEGAGDVAAALAAALDLSAPAATPPELAPPADLDEARRVETIYEPFGWWLDQMAHGARPIEERLVWFWHDHFATSLVKVRAPYLVWNQHLLLRRHATGSFEELLRGMVRDPAMLVYLDGITNSRDARNENFGRECLELFTMGRGHYTQEDVVAASRAFSGWVVNVPGRRFTRSDLPLWNSFLAPLRFDDGPKTLLGVTGRLDVDGALDVILDHPATPRRIAAKLYEELVGLAPDDGTVDRLGEAFGRDYRVMPLVEAIVGDPAFTSDEAFRAKVRTPVEKAVALLQAVPVRVDALRQVGDALRRIGYVPFAPPNVAGFPKGERLLGPHTLVHAFDLMAAVSERIPALGVDELFARFGILEVTDRSRRVVEAEGDPLRRVALVLGSPELAVT